MRPNLQLCYMLDLRYNPVQSAPRLRGSEAPRLRGSEAPRLCRRSLTDQRLFRNQAPSFVRRYLQRWIRATLVNAPQCVPRTPFTESPNRHSLRTSLALRYMGEQLAGPNRFAPTALTRQVGHDDGRGDADPCQSDCGLPPTGRSVPLRLCGVTFGEFRIVPCHFRPHTLQFCVESGVSGIFTLLNCGALQGTRITGQRLVPGVQRRVDALAEPGLRPSPLIEAIAHARSVRQLYENPKRCLSSRLLGDLPDGFVSVRHFAHAGPRRTHNLSEARYHIDCRDNGRADSEHPTLQTRFQLCKGSIQLGARDRFSRLRHLAACCRDNFGLTPVHAGGFQFANSSGGIKGRTHIRKVIHTVGDSSPFLSGKPGRARPLSRGLGRFVLPGTDPNFHHIQEGRRLTNTACSS